MIFCDMQLYTIFFLVKKFFITIFIYIGVGFIPVTK